MHIIIATFTEEDKDIYKWKHTTVRWWDMFYPLWRSKDKPSSWITDHIITIFKANESILDNMEGDHIPLYACLFPFIF